ncbi:hypothetical protein [Corallococcus sp. EGB]|uniref:hypothetical protein n=1 Tax=Corallococcus sp. EGB TaxID=1521117 RepID=UPI001CBBA313|nr:hypothetical protein [Corallococcus sp. EGB]
MRETLARQGRRALKLARKELDVHRKLHGDARAALHRMEARSPELARARARAYAYAVFPSLGQGSVLLGGTWGLGEVFRHGQLIGYAAMGQLTLGVQLGGQTSSEVVLFQDREAYQRFKQGGTGLALGAAATLVKAGAAKTRGPAGSTRVSVATDGGLWAGAAIGAQRTFVVPAVLTRSGALRRILTSIPSLTRGTPPPNAGGTRESAMAKAQTSNSGGKGLSRLTAVLKRRKAPVEEKTRPQKVAEHTREAMRRAGDRGRMTLEHMRDRVPSGDRLRERAGKVRTWAADQLGEHAVAIGLTTLAAGVAGAALLPVSDRERRALGSVSHKVKGLTHAVGKNPQVARVARSVDGAVARVRHDNGASTEEKPPAPRTRNPAATRGKKAAGRPAAAAKTSRRPRKKASGPQPRK